MLSSGQRYNRFLLFFLDVHLLSSVDDKNKLIDWSKDLSDSWRCVGYGPQVGFVGSNGQRGGACAAGGAEGHEATQERRGAPQVSSDNLW